MMPSQSAGGVEVPLLEVRDLVVGFGGVTAVRGLDFTIRHGETMALVGESGCGKSATALALLRLIPPPGQIEDGTISFEGDDVLRLTDAELRDLRGGKIAMIFQEPMTSLNPVLTVGRQITEAISRHNGLSARAARSRAIELLDLVKIPNPHRRINDFPHSLSGGMRQRVMIAMAVACQPRLLIADEPTTALDVTIQAQVLELLDRLRRDLSMGLLLVTHDLGVVSDWADRVVVMYAGRKCEEAPVATLFQAPVHPYTRGLIDCSPKLASGLHFRQGRMPEIPGNIASATAWRAVPSRPAAISHATIVGPSGHTQSRYVIAITSLHALCVRQPTSAMSLLSVDQLHAGYHTAHGELRAVDGVSFEIGAGETVALVGESGCGKSTLGKALLRLIPHKAGAVRFDGADITRLSGKALRPHRRKMQMVFQDPSASLNPRQTVHQLLATPLAVHGVSGRQERQRQIEAMSERVGLSAGVLSRYPHEFSGGQKQRISIARALILRPALLVCDEPVSALDVSVQAQIINLLVELKAEYSLSYLFISHDLGVVRYIADRIMVMYLGQIVENAPHHSFWQRPLHPYTRGLMRAVPGQSAPGQHDRTAPIVGDLPNPIDPPKGCRFHPRCPLAADICRCCEPPLQSVLPDHLVACHFAGT
jgi:peptide/nickel transport system ATP-binding protein